MNKFSFFFLSVLSLSAKVWATFNCQYHIILPQGKTCSSIASTFEINGEEKYSRTRDIIINNPNINCNQKMASDTKICVFEEANIYDVADTFEIEEGDTCETIAAALKVKDINQLIRLNYLYHFNCNNVSNYVGKEFLFFADGIYEPNFSGSTEISYKSKA